MNTAYITESNKIASPYAWVWLLEITTAGYAQPLRLTNNNASISWPTATPQVYFRVPFTIDDINVSISGEFPEYKLIMEDVDLSGSLRTRVEASGGLVGSVVRFMVVHSNHLDIATPAIDEYADILSCELTARAVVFTIGIPNLLSRRFPRDRYVPGYCRHIFEGALCQYEQPVYSSRFGASAGLPVAVISDNVTFETQPLADPTHPVNKITARNVNLVTMLFDSALPPGEWRDIPNWALAKDTGFTVTGSLYNDGFYLAENWYTVNPIFVYVKTGDESGQVLVPEVVLTGVTISLGYNACDKTLNACKLRDNTHNFGGSPGIMGGIYG